MRQGRLVTLVALVIISIAACSKRTPVTNPTPGGGSQPVTPPSTPSSSGNNTGADPGAEAARMAAVVMETVFFDYDRSDIRNDAVSTLQAKIPILRAQTGVRLRIEGHADERGSIEYNLALGQRRAQAVKDYLVGFGIDAGRITVESLGEDRPSDPGASEAAFAKNRRAEFVITAGFGR